MTLPTSSWGLVTAVQAGDREAFGALYERYWGVVFRVVRSRVRERVVAEDLTSETFLRALRGMSSVSDQGRDVGAWLVRIAQNVVRDHQKSGRYRRECLTRQPLDVADQRGIRYPWGAGVVAPGPEEAALRAAVGVELMRALAGLGRAQRECVWWRFFAGLSVSETARVMGRTETVVKGLQHRAVRALAGRLRRRRPRRGNFAHRGIPNITVLTEHPATDDGMVARSCHRDGADLERGTPSPATRARDRRHSNPGEPVPIRTDPTTPTPLRGRLS